MAEVTLLVSAVLAAVAGLVFVVVGNILRQRDVPPASRRAWTAFVVWWYAFGLVSILLAVQHLMGYLGYAGVPLFMTLFRFRLLMIVVSLWGLVYYLVYLYTGEDRVFWPLTVGYGLYYLFLEYYISTSDPMGVTVARWSVDIQYAMPLEERTLWPVLILLLLVPQILGALAYLATVRRLEDPTLRYRVTMVSLGLILWFGTVLFAIATGLDNVDWWEVVSRVLSVVAAIMVLFAYKPPHIVSSRWTIEDISEGG